MANRRLIQAICDSQQKREIETLRSEQFRLAAQQELVWDSTKISTHQEFVEIAGKSFSFFNIFSLEWVWFCRFLSLLNTHKLNFILNCRFYFVSFWKHMRLISGKIKKHPG